MFIVRASRKDGRELISHVGQANTVGGLRLAAMSMVERAAAKRLALEEIMEVDKLLNTVLRTALESGAAVRIEYPIAGCVLNITEST